MDKQGRDIGNFKIGDYVYINPDAHPFERPLTPHNRIGYIKKYGENGWGQKAYVIVWEGRTEAAGRLFWDQDLIPAAPTNKAYKYLLKK